MIIHDGKGRGYAAGVTKRGKLETLSESLIEGAVGALEKRLFLLLSGDLVLTDDQTSAGLFFKYFGTERVLIERITFTVGTSDGEGACQFDIMQNPTSITGGSETRALNRNFAGTDTLAGLKSIGGQGAAFQGGESVASLRLTNPGVTFLDASNVPYVLEANNSIGVNITPPPGNTNATYRVAIFLLEVLL